MVPMNPAPPVMTIRFPVRGTRASLDDVVTSGLRRGVPWTYAWLAMLVLAPVAVALGGFTSSPASVTCAEDHVLAERRRERRAGETWTLTCDPAGGTLAASTRRVPTSSRRAEERSSSRPCRRTRSAREIYGGPQQARVVGLVQGQARVGQLQPDERLPHLALGPALAVAPALGRRRNSRVTIGAREDRPLRRRGAPPAPRDRAGARGAGCESSPSTATRRRPVSLRPTSPRSSTSPTSRR